MHRLYQWLCEFPVTISTAVSWLAWQFSESAIKSMNTVAQVSAFGSFGEVVQAVKELGLPVVLIVVIGFAIRELWTFFKPLIKNSFAKRNAYIDQQAENGRKLSELLEVQGRLIKSQGSRQRKHQLTLDQIKQQGDANGQTLDKLLNVVASGTAAIKGTDTVSVIEEARNTQAS